MSLTQQQLEQLAEAHATISDVYTAAAAALVEDDAPAKPAAKKATAAKGKPAAAVEDDDLPPPSTAGTKGKTPAKTKPAAVEPDEDDAPTEADVIAAAQALIQATNKETAVKIIKKHGASKVAELDEALYPKVIAALQAAMPAEDAGSDDDI